MAIDPSKFHLVNVADTCSVWNILSSARLHSAAKDARCDFYITSFVRYECLVKPRRAPTTADLELRRRLVTHQRNGSFKVHSCSIDDLQDVKVLESRKRLGMGELSSIAFAMKIAQAVITDDQKARKLAQAAGHPLIQTTPHLFSWLIFTGKLGDSDHAVVVDQHIALEGDLAPHLRDAYHLALQCRLNARTSSPLPSGVPVFATPPAPSSGNTRAP
ncbi:hypothetical protein [Variovorax paradoxus]|uniref:hypothetical protein n=1 Tax=Variovorax paradoxus TaxID=34073 RepID=UPI003D65FD24